VGTGFAPKIPIGICLFMWWEHARAEEAVQGENGTAENGLEGAEVDVRGSAAATRDGEGSNRAWKAEARNLRGHTGALRGPLTTTLGAAPPRFLLGLVFSARPAPRSVSLRHGRVHERPMSATRYGLGQSVNRQRQRARTGRSQSAVAWSRARESEFDSGSPVAASRSFRPVSHRLPP